ncbi:MAG: acetate--CoA ligase family protein [Chloroflexota bacterium]|nr:acetate--CoA ligase family protein [Chloroflexota bacterium]
MGRDPAAIERLFYPRGTAVIGSASEGKLGYELIRQMVEGGYERVFAVNPRAEGAFGVRAADAVAKIEGPVDLAVIASPPSTVPGVLADCGKAGVAAAAIITAGFSEVGNDEAERAVARAGAEHGVRFVGPNCAGLVNTAHHLYPTLETRPPRGGAAVVAQSGAIGGILLAWAKAYGLGISKFVSYGNGADLNEIDFLRYLAEDAETEVVALYIESTGDGRAFMEAVHACAQQKPVVAIKAGRTRAGQRATLSHTGSMAGADAVYEAALGQCGAIRVHTVEEMFDFCKVMTGVRGVERLTGRGDGTASRVAIVTNSGGPGVLAADRAEEMGLEVAEPGPAVRSALREFLPGHCALRNPIDLTVEGTGDWYRRTLEAVSEEYDAAVAINVATPYLDSMALAQGIADGAEGGMPVVTAFLPEEIVGGSVDYLQGRGVPNFATGERAVTALGLVGRYDPRLAACVRAPFEAQGKRPPGDGQMLEPAAMAWLEENGIPVPEFRFVEARDEVVRACREIGYPVAMKVVSPEILHKSDVGGVILDVDGDGAAREAFDALELAAEGRDFRGVVVYPMIEGGQEVLLGLSRDPQFGPVVAFGLGGVYTELWGDVVLRVAPVDRSEAERMIGEIDASPLLEGVRGQARRDLDALAEALVTVSELAFRYPEIDEVDLNPVFLFEEGEGLVVGDVRVITRKTTKESEP